MKRGRAVKVVPARHDYDCGTACLAMLLEVPYGDAAAAVRSIVGADKANGTDTRDLICAAKRLGVALRSVRRQKDYLDGQTGILGVLPETDKSDLPDNGHWCVFKSGVIVDTDGTVWPNAADYFRLKHAKPTTLIVRA